MKIASYQEAFGASDKTTKAMAAAVEEWFDLYYRDSAQDGEDPCQRIAYTVVNKLVRTVFAEYDAGSDHPFTAGILQALDAQKELAVQLALVGGECYVKPWLSGSDFRFTLIPRDRVLIFSRNHRGEPSDMGFVEQSTRGNAYYTLLERRSVDENGYLTITNRLFCSYDGASLGGEVSLTSHPGYAALPARYTYETPVGSVGLVSVKTPMLNCVDGSADGISVYAPAVGLIHAIDRNEYQLKGEFDRGESRVFTSADLLDGNALDSHLFVGLDEDVERLGLTVYSPQLREQSFLNRKQEYLRNVESVIGLKRGLLSDANVEERTATEIASSQGEHALTVLDFQRMWRRAVDETVQLCALLGRLYGVAGAQAGTIRVDWGNGVLHDRDAMWEDYKDMVARGLLRPEVALGWRFGMAADTDADFQAIRSRLMPQELTMDN